MKLIQYFYEQANIGNRTTALPVQNFIIHWTIRKTLDACNLFSRIIKFCKGRAVILLPIKCIFNKLNSIRNY